MDAYSMLRAFADSWFLIAMFAFFVGACVFAFWPSLRTARDEAASIPLRDDFTAPGKKTAGCTRQTDLLKGLDNG